MTSSPNSAHKIMSRKEAKDVFITPDPVAKIHINRVSNILDKITLQNPGNIIGATWFDNSCNSGVYYNNYPEENESLINIKIKMDILADPVHQDFLKSQDWDEPILMTLGMNKNLVICSNPPYSILNKWLEATLQLQPIIFSYLLAAHAITPVRLEKMEKAGYVLADLTLVSVRGWYGMSFMTTFVQKKFSNMVGQSIHYDRTKFIPETV